MPNSTDFIRFRRRRKKRWEINLENARKSDHDKFVPAFFSEEEWQASFRPRKRNRVRNRPPKHVRQPRFNYGVKPRFKERNSKPVSRVVTLGVWTKRNSQGQSIPVVQNTNIMSSPEVRTITDLLDVERTWDEIHPGPPYRDGGPFTNIKIKLPHDEVRGNGVYTTRPAQRINGQYFVYSGGFAQPVFDGDPTLIATYRGAGKSPWNNSLLPGFSQYGPMAYAKLKPSPEQASVGQFIAELREMPKAIENLRNNARDFHDIWRDTGGFEFSPSMAPKKAADEFLGYNFGWLPFLADIENFINVTRNLDQFIRDVTRMNNSWIKKRSVIDSGSSQTLINRTFNSGFSPTGPNINDCCELFNYQGTNCFFASELILRTEFKVWAEGEFKFYRVEFDGGLSEHNSAYMAGQRLMTLYGARVTPSFLWKITPWTWLADWTTRIGDNISNISAQLIDSVVSKYMYVMHHQTKSYDKSVVLNTWDQGVKVLRWARSVETKQRDGQLSPYGFGVGWNNLSPRQWSILGAIGISKFT